MIIENKNMGCGHGHLASINDHFIRLHGEGVRTVRKGKGGGKAEKMYKAAPQCFGNTVSSSKWHTGGPTFATFLTFRTSGGQRSVAPK
jgi:hypothetical protein